MSLFTGITIRCSDNQSSVIINIKGINTGFIDNKEMSHVPGNAKPEGPIHVEVDLEITSRFSNEW